jgi:DMSO reductase anchor subunit
LAATLGVAPDRPATGLVGIGAGLLLAAIGLLASTLHLGRPERAWRALSQWRSSWLSREGIAAMATFLPGLALGWLWVLGSGPQALIGLVLAACAVVTVLCTAMIYASLAPIGRWHSRWVPVCYLGFAVLTGAAWLWLVLAATAEVGAAPPALVALAAVLAWGLKLLYWRHTDAPAAPDAGTATGLGALGRVRLVEPPHTGENYILREMGFRIARKHAAKLRRIALVLGGALPAVLGLIGLLAGGSVLLPLLAVLAAMIGTLVERWLFFAEARHTVMLYYGAERA